MSHTKPTSDAYTNARPNAYTESTALAADDMFQAYDTSAAANRKFSAATLRQDIPNTQTDSYQLVLGDAGKTIYMNKGTANTLTIPTFVTVAFPYMKDAVFSDNKMLPTLIHELTHARQRQIFCRHSLLGLPIYCFLACPLWREITIEPLAETWEAVTRKELHLGGYETNED
jgi:uncharacterized protein YjaZ